MAAEATWRRGRAPRRRALRHRCSNGRRWTALWECTTRRLSRSPSHSSTLGFCVCRGCGSSTVSTSGLCCAIPDPILSFAHVRCGFCLLHSCASFLVDGPFLSFLCSDVFWLFFSLSLLRVLGVLYLNAVTCVNKWLFNW